ncbi:MAG: EAL domain-containing protein [Gammaproteobacteria bacterium]|nr:EAL domain-containing protein [Gammaproteobacteria bacterium]
MRTFRLRNLRFRQQLTLLFVIGALLMALIGSLGASKFASDLVAREMREQGINVARTLGLHAKLAMLYESKEAAADAVKSIAGFPDIEVLDIRSVAGTSLYGGRASVFPQQVSAASADFAELDLPDRWLFRLQVYAEPSPDATGEVERPERLGSVTIALYKRTQQELARRIFQGIIIVFSLATGLLLVLLIQMTHRLTSPLEALARIMRQAEAGDLRVRADLHRGQADVLQMQHAFNAMMEQLENREGELQRARDAAVESARLKGEFAANVTHELRTPMNGVLGLLDLLSDGKLNARQAEYVELARKSAEGLLGLVDNILDFSKNDSGMAQQESGEIILRDLIEELVELVGTQALGKGVDIGYFMAVEVPATLSIDASKVKQVLINLLGNAVKFTEAGEVFLTVTRSSGNPSSLRFAVSDTGIGIEPALQQQIFEPFTQGDASASKRYQGTGLGLTISRQLVEMMGGEIGLDSAPGHGSTFWFELPCAAPFAPPAPARPPGSDAGTVLCLLASDNSYAFIADTLMRHGVRAVHAVNMQAARGHLVESGARNSADLVLVDEGIYFAHSDEFDLLAAAVPGRVQVLRNPFAKLQITSTDVGVLDKPLSFAPIAHLAEALRTGLVVAPAAAEPALPGPEAFGHLRVLLVEDNAVNQKVASEMLLRLGIAADLAEHGQQALAMVARADYDLILMDCNMPVMDGYDATRRIRALETDGRVPIIAMTAGTSEQEHARATEAGFTDFLIKPVRLDLLAARITRWAPVRSRVATPGKTAVSPPAAAPGHAYSEQAMNELHASVGDVTYRMIESFLEDTPVYLDSLKSALRVGDAQRAYEIAHTIRGSASNFGAKSFVDAILALEAFSKAGDLSGSDALLDIGTERFAALRKDLERHQASESGHHTGAPGKYQLLIADDDRTLRLALRGTFAGEEFDVLEAADGAQAIALCERVMPDIILMDAMMPEVSGFDACQRIRQLPGGAELPVLMVTSLDDEDAIVRAFAAGASDYLTKPIHFTVLKERVGRLIKANRAEARARTLAFADALTGLPNRARLTQELGLALNQASINNERIAVFFLDLDNFKNINDSLGHQVGDLLLKAVADRLRSSVRRSDFIARLGGDEFTVILRRVESEQVVATVARNILLALSEPFVFIHKRMMVSTSIGISLFPDHGADVSSLLKHADLAMFKAKETKNQFCFYQDGMEDAVSHKMQLQQELRQAIDNDQLVLYFQPQYDLTTDTVVAAEALVRWPRDDGQVLTPGAFIPLAEETGLITELTDLVLEKACGAIRGWLIRGYAVKLSVNLSGRDFEAPGRLMQRIADLTREYEIPARLLELEITESMLMADPERSRAELLELKNAGFSLSIDDFGSGYSSLYYLKNLPVDVLKIDRAFIKDLDDPQNRRDIPVITGIIALARSLGLHTVAEGVETHHQRTVIQSLGCEMIQGYLISKPLPCHEFEQAFLEQFRAASKEPHLRQVNPG